MKRSLFILPALVLLFSVSSYASSNYLTMSNRSSDYILFYNCTDHNLTVGSVVGGFQADWKYSKGNCTLEGSSVAYTNFTPNINLSTGNISFGFYIVDVQVPSESRVQFVNSSSSAHFFAFRFVSAPQMLRYDLYGEDWQDFQPYVNLDTQYIVMTYDIGDFVGYYRSYNTTTGELILNRSGRATRNGTFPYVAFGAGDSGTFVVDDIRMWQGYDFPLEVSLDRDNDTIPDISDFCNYTQPPWNNSVNYYGCCNSTGCNDTLMLQTNNKSYIKDSMLLAFEPNNNYGWGRIDPEGITSLGLIWWNLSKFITPSSLNKVLQSNLTFYDIQGGYCNISFYPILQSWVEGNCSTFPQGCLNNASAGINGTTWKQRWNATDADWITPGGDYNSSINETIESNVTGDYRVLLINKTFERIINNTISDDQGILIISPSNCADFKSSDETTNPAQRPKLTLSYFYSPAPVDTCTAPASGDWSINCADNCQFSTPSSVPGNVIITGSGVLTLSSSWTFTGTNQNIYIDKGCTLNIVSGGQIG